MKSHFFQPPSDAVLRVLPAEPFNWPHRASRPATKCTLDRTKTTKVAVWIRPIDSQNWRLAHMNRATYDRIVVFVNSTKHVNNDIPLL